MSGTNIGATRASGRWVATAARNWSTEDRAAASQLLLDTIGCIGAGSRLPLMSSMLTPYTGRGMAPVIGSTQLVTNEAAALIMGTVGHALEIDEMHYGAGLHASVGIVPAILAMSHGRTVTIDDLLDALIVGLEVDTQIGRAMGLAHTKAGWHSTGTVGVFGAVAACARLLKLDATTITNALALAASTAGGIKVQFGTEAKPFHAGWAAKSAVECVNLARAGLGADHTALESEKGGFGQLYSGGGSPDWSLVQYPASGESSIRTSGLAIKWHANCGSAHRAVDAVGELLIEHGFAPGDVDHVETYVGAVNLGNLRFSDPQEPKQAQFSMQWAIARALLGSHEQLTAADFTAEALADAETRALARRVSMSLMPGNETMVNRLPHRVVIRLTDGSVLEREVVWPKGTLGLNPLTADDLESKFAECMAGAPAHVVTEVTLLLSTPQGQVSRLMALLQY